MADKVESAVKKVAVDVADVKRDMKTFRAEQQAMRDSINELGKLVREISTTQIALTNTVAQAVTQLALGKTVEARVQRLEDAVFGTKQ